MKDAVCSRRSLTRYLAELKKQGLIYGEQRTTTTGKHSTTTYLLYDENHAKAAYKPPKSRAAFGARHMSQMAHGEVRNITPITEGMRDFA